MTRSIKQDLLTNMKTATTYRLIQLPIIQEYGLSHLGSYGKVRVMCPSTLNPTITPRRFDIQWRVSQRSSFLF
jgi:hypothetical protein